MITSKLTLKGREPYPLPKGIGRRMSYILQHCGKAMEQAQMYFGDYSHLNVYSRSFALGLQVKKVNLK